ncbi:MAG: dihydroneopterin aldolase [Verrucomicrobiota bacterium]
MNTMAANCPLAFPPQYPEIVASPHHLMSDQIHIKGLRLVTTIGVPEEERSRPQTVSVHASITLSKSFAGFDDQLEDTIDYYRVSETLRDVAASGERLLIETLVEELASAVLSFAGVAAVTLEVEKFILADCESVSVVITRERGNN